MGFAKGAEWVYWTFALMGSCFFLFRLIAMAVGQFGGDVSALDHGGDAPAGVGEGTQGHVSDSTDAAFKLFSIQSLTGFFMTFGWAGLACQKQFGMGTTVSFFTSLAAGGVAMYLTTALFRAMGRLTSAGDVFLIQKTVGLSGIVYVRIPGSGRGQIKLVINDAVRYLDAVSEDKDDLESFTDVAVVRVADATTVSVRKTK